MIALEADRCPVASRFEFNFNLISRTAIYGMQSTWYTIRARVVGPNTLSEQDNYQINKFDNESYRSNSKTFECTET